MGPFHLVMLLFGDYISHVIALKNERAKQISRLRSVIRSGKFAQLFFQDFKIC